MTNERPLPSRVEDAISLLLDCDVVERRSSERLFAVEVALAAMATFREDCKGLTARPCVAAYEHLEPLADALRGLRATFSALELAQSARGIQAAQVTDAVLAELDWLDENCGCARGSTVPGTAPAEAVRSHEAGPL